MLPSIFPMVSESALTTCSWRLLEEKVVSWFLRHRPSFLFIEKKFIGSYSTLFWSPVRSHTMLILNISYYWLFIFCMCFVYIYFVPILNENQNSNSIKFRDRWRTLLNYILVISLHLSYDKFFKTRPWLSIYVNLDQCKHRRRSHTIN